MNTKTLMDLANELKLMVDNLGLDKNVHTEEYNKGFAAGYKKGVEDGREDSVEEMAEAEAFKQGDRD